MPRKGLYADIGTWIEEQRELVRRDWDNVILFTGVEGTGKTTWATQILKALDESFDLDHLHFNLEDLLEDAQDMDARPRYSAVLWDEARLNKRRAMHGTTIEVLDFLQDCRGLNLHIGICFPHEGLLDSAVKDHRVRWRWHIPVRGVAQLWRRVEKRSPGGKSYWDWKFTGDEFDYEANTGTWDRAYRAKKEAHMRSKHEVKSKAPLFNAKMADLVLAELGLSQ